MSYAKEQQMLAVVIVVVILAIALGFWWRNSSRHKFDAGGGNTVYKSRPGSGEIPTRELMGALDLNIQCDRSISGCSSDSGWVFIDGELQGGIPLHIQPWVVPGTYEVRTVMSTTTSNGGMKFVTASWPIMVERQGTARISKDLTGILKDGCRSTGSIEQGSRCDQSRVLEDTYSRYGTNDFNSVRDDVTKELKMFAESEEWKPVQAAAQYLDINPPMRRRIWMDLTAQMGGPREVDEGQLQVLKKWFSRDVHARLSSKLPPNAGPEFQGLEKFVQDRQDAVREECQGMIDHLKKAPEE